MRFLLLPRLCNKDAMGRLRKLDDQDDQEGKTLTARVESLKLLVVKFSKVVVKF